MITEGGQWSTTTTPLTNLTEPTVENWAHYVTASTPSGYSASPRAIYNTDLMELSNTVMNLVMTDNYTNNVWKVTPDGPGNTGLVIPEGVNFGVRCTTGSAGIGWRCEICNRGHY